MTATNNPGGKQRPPDKKGSAPKSSAQTSESLADPDLLAITINVKTGQASRWRPSTAPACMCSLTRKRRV